MEVGQPNLPWNDMKQDLSFIYWSCLETKVEVVTSHKHGHEAAANTSFAFHGVALRLIKVTSHKHGHEAAANPSFACHGTHGFSHGCKRCEQTSKTLHLSIGVAFRLRLQLISMGMKLLQTLVFLVMVMASAMAARDVNKQGMYHEDKASINGRGSFETLTGGNGLDSRTNGWPETGIHFYIPMPKPLPKKP
ncbi:hypothetical protein J5N97_024253 [Dioscorea zingiberensis]|uniref:Uncharacterized protein n=1 Tax=Dioscorea zingiberensis TaxID=325984 RepID=A0A9D5H8K7_9LILI|nr:hypothetical protein J5N97_024253 [Dioscorea zingiberensis]